MCTTMIYGRERQGTYPGMDIYSTGFSYRRSHEKAVLCLDPIHAVASGRCGAGVRGLDSALVQNEI